MTQMKLARCTNPKCVVVQYSGLRCPGTCTVTLEEAINPAEDNKVWVRRKEEKEA